AAGKEAGISRLYGGIHYRPSIETGNVQGKKVGENVNNLLVTRK
ncbi:MAG: haloperoxidase, partial [Thermoanaerobaculia bacterium]|nr:haloperoxidase [Thermoanaerobaculia bacterium]